MEMRQSISKIKEQWKSLDAAFTMNPVDIYVARDMTKEEKITAFDYAIDTCLNYKKQLLNNY